MIKSWTWDWQEQPPMSEIGAAVTEMSAKGQVFACHPETDSDSYALVLADRELTPEQAKQIYDHPNAVVQVEVIIEPPTGVITEVLEMDLSDLIGLEGMARQEKIIDIAADYVNDLCSWGAIELGADGDEEN